MMFETEADLCDAFISTVPKTWTVYAETEGYDIVLVHETGFQIGVEAKLRLIPKVLTQVLPHRYLEAGPDCMAVLVPNGEKSELAALAGHLGITVLTTTRQNSKWISAPSLPEPEKMELKPGGYYWDSGVWTDQFPSVRMVLPEYVPDVRAGVPSPVILGRWKIQAMKMCQFIEQNGSVERKHFRFLDIDPSRWMTGYWLKSTSTRGVWVAGPSFPGPQFRKEHRLVWDQIADDYLKWSAGLPASTELATQLELPE